MAGNTNAPAPLNPDNGQNHWEVVWDVEQRRWYYVEQETKKVSWEAPAGCSLPLPKNPPPGAEEELGALPAGWRAYYDPNSQRMCFQNLETKATTWQRPESNSNGIADTIETNTASPNTDDLPEGWRKVKDEKSNRYYYVSPNNVTQWEHPSQKSQQKTQDSPSRVAESKTASDWEPRWDSDNRRWCFINAKTDKHQYKKPDDFTKELPDPPELPTGWSAAWDNKQSKFYFLSPEKQPQWDAPQLTARAQMRLEASKVDDAKTQNSKAPSSTDQAQDELPQRGGKVEDAKTQNAEAPSSTDQGQDGLPPGWSKAFDKGHQKYYYFNRERNVTQWHPPEPLASNELALKNNLNIIHIPKQVEISAENNGKQVDTSSTEKALAPMKDNVIVSKTQETKDDPKMRRLNRAQLKMLAKLVLKDDSKNPQYDFDGVLEKFWKARADDTTSLIEFQEFLGTMNR